MTRQEYASQDGYILAPILSKQYWIERFIKSEQYWIRRYVRLLRSEEYYTFERPNTLLRYLYQARKNRLGSRLGFFISAGNFARGLRIYHYGSIIVHPGARIGEGCVLHGNCCIGSKGGFPDTPPTIGQHVDIGQGAQILGDIHVADGVRIAAGAIVTHSIDTPGVTVVGIPAQPLSSRGKDRTT